MNETNISASRIEKADSTLWQLWCRFYPLAMTDFAMALGDTFRTMAMTRMPNPELSIAAIGVVKSVAVFLESPIIMILHASTALSRYRQQHNALWRFTVLLSGFLTSLFLLLCANPFYNWLFHSVFGLGIEISKAAHIAFVLMVPWPATIAIRRFLQGLLIREQCEKAMFRAGLIRLAFTVAVLAAGNYFQYNTIIIAALSLVGAVVIELLAVIFYTRGERFKNYPIDCANSPTKPLPTSIASTARYYAPLGTTTLVVWAGRAAMLAVLARATDGTLAIAAWTAASGFILPIANATRMVQQVVISSPHIDDRKLQTFGGLVGFVFCIPLFFLVTTQSGRTVLSFLLGNNTTLLGPAISAVFLSICMPFLVALQNTYQGFLIISGKHWWINCATVVNICLSLLLAAVLIHLGFSGVSSAAIATSLAQAVEVILLVFISFIYLKG